MIRMIVAMDEHAGIGRDNGLLCHLPADLKYFKMHTLHKPVVMGRRTFESIGRPLPHRPNWVLSHDLMDSRVVVYHNVAMLMSAVMHTEDVVIIGGAQLFDIFLKYTDVLYITKIHHVFAADVFFPPVDWRDWDLHASVYRRRDEHHAYDMTFETYVRKEDA